MSVKSLGKNKDSAGAASKALMKAIADEKARKDKIASKFIKRASVLQSCELQKLKITDLVSTFGHNPDKETKPEIYTPYKRKTAAFGSMRSSL